jgi:hypothetical protein
MKRSLIAAVLLPLLLPACAEADHYLFHDLFAQAHGRGVNEHQYKADVQACGQGPGAEWCRIAADDGNLDRMFPLEMKPAPRGTTYAYDASQCAGGMDHGLCQGVSRPPASPASVCHGEFIDGVCAGPIY